MKKKLFVAGMLFLLTFQSCSNNDELTGQESGAKIEKSNISNRLNARSADSKSLSGFIANQLSIEAEIKDLLDNESKVDYSGIQLGLDKIRTIEELQSLLKSSNIVEAEKLILLYQEMDSNNEMFINSNPEFYSKYNEEERQKILTAEIDSRLGYNEETGALAKTNCQANFTKASNRCMRTYAIAMAGVAVSGFFSLGVGTAVGGTVATIAMIACNSDAEDDYHDCVKDGGQP